MMCCSACLGHTEMVRLLLESKANVSDTNSEGHTLLHIAIVSPRARTASHNILCCHLTVTAPDNALGKQVSKDSSVDQRSSCAR